MGESLEKSDNKNRSWRLGNAIRAATLGAGMTLAGASGADAAPQDSAKTEGIQSNKQGDFEMKERMAHVSERVERLNHYAQELENFLGSNLTHQIRCRSN